jgi:HTH-type transcriptional repressor of NAD biosynthesis genes
MTTGFFEGKFLPLHTGHQWAIHSASLRVDILYVVLGFNRKRDAEICRRDNIKEIMPELRMSWLGNICNRLKNVKIISIEDFDEEYNFGKMVAIHKKMIPNFNVVFSSEIKYDNIFKQIYPWAKSVLIDPNRTTVNISAEAIRKDPFKYWDYLPHVVKKFFNTKILITGVESVGKSTMVKLLAKHFNCSKDVQEVGREYCEEYSNILTAEMFDNIAIDHYREIERSSNFQYSFIDTDAVVTQYYLEKYCNTNSKFIDAMIEKQKNYFDKIFFMEPTVPWVDDGFRFLENSRQEDNEYLKSLYEKYKYKNLNIIDNQNYQGRFEHIVKLLIN